MCRNQYCNPGKSRDRRIGVWSRNPKGVLLHTEKDGKIIRESITTLQGNYLEYYDAVYHALQDKSSLFVTGEDGLNVIKIIEAAYQSNKEKKIIELKKQTL